VCVCVCVVVSGANLPYWPIGYANFYALRINAFF
jgi:hypothetical protein